MRLAQINISALLAASLLIGGCGQESVVYNKDRKVVANVWEGQFIELKGSVACNGSVEVFSDDDFYGMYFMTNVTAANAFYLTSAKHYGYDSLPLKIRESQGWVRMLGEREVLIDVQYRDDTGKWVRLPINGRHRVTQVWPDDIPKNPRMSL